MQFVAITLHSKLPYQDFIRQALTTLGKCLMLFFRGVTDKLDIIPTITYWVPNHINNEDYMCGVATVMAGFLKEIRLERVLVTDVFKVIASLLRHHMKSRYIVRTLTQAIAMELSELVTLDEYYEYTDWVDQNRTKKVCMYACMHVCLLNIDDFNHAFT
jgi:hypothetical protein